MTWEWSHTVEGIDNARDNTYSLPKETLAQIYAEWQCARKEKYVWQFVNCAWESELENAMKLDPLTLAEGVWNRAEELRECSNVGHYAYLCPFGCSVHMVPFGKIKFKIRSPQHAVIS